MSTRKVQAPPGAEAGQGFAGRFDPPALGADRSPVRVAGPGRLVLEEESVVAEGFAPKGSGLRALGFLAAVGAFAGLITWIRLVWFPGSSMLLVGMISGMVGIGLYRLLMTGASHDPAAPVVERFPLSGVTDARADVRDGEALVLRLEFDRFRGTLHFKPEGGPEALRAALIRRGIKVRAR